MKRLQALFHPASLSWRRVIVLAVVSGILTALINMMPMLKDTSLDDVAHNLEVWIVLGIWICTHAASAKEAAWKVFVFFLISQPLVYLVEAPWFGWSVFQAYPLWFAITLLTLPGGDLAWYMGRPGWKGNLALWLAEALLIIEGVQYLYICIGQFPRQLLAVVFCFGSALVLLRRFCPSASHTKKMAAALAPVLVLCLGWGWITRQDQVRMQTLRIPGSDPLFAVQQWKAEVDADDFVHIHGIEGHYLKLSALNTMKSPATLTCTAPDGKQYTYQVRIENGQLVITPASS